MCTGALVLAGPGCSTGRPATTHWSAAPIVERCYPRIRIETERLLAPADDDRIVTSGGAAAWEDLAVHLIARLAGAAEAVRVAKIFLFGDRTEGQLLYAGARRPRQHADAVVADAQTWIADHYATANPVTRLVERSGLPERSFKRRFKAATGYADRLRADAADRGGEAGAGDQRPPDRRGGLRGRLRGSDLLPPPVQARHRRDAGALPPALRPIARPA